MFTIVENRGNKTILVKSWVIFRSLNTGVKRKHAENLIIVKMRYKYVN